MVLVLLFLGSSPRRMSTEMEWQDIYEEGGVTRIRGTRLKTNCDYVVPLNEQAKHYLGEQGNKKAN